MNTITKPSLRTLFGAALAAVALSNTAPAAGQFGGGGGAGRQFFGLTGVAPGQFVRLNFTVIGPSQDDLQPRVCSVRLALFDADGAELVPVILPAEFNVPEGESRSRHFSRPPRTKGTLLVRAVVEGDPPTEADPPSPDVDPPSPDLPPCTVLSTLEVVDALTGRTTVVLPPAVHIDPPQPDLGSAAP